MLQVKRDVRWVGRVGQGGQQFFGCIQRQLSVNRVVFALGLHRANANARCFRHKNQFVGLQGRSH